MTMMTTSSKYTWSTALGEGGEGVGGVKGMASAWRAADPGLNPALSMKVFSGPVKPPA